MVRREEAGRPSGVPDERPALRCAFPAGASPASASVGAPSSRPQVAGRDPDARAGRRKPVPRRMPCGGEQQRGPQHEVKPAASTELRRESRAAHVTAKATSIPPAPNRAVDLSGVGGAARVEGNERNTRGPSAQPKSVLERSDLGEGAQAPLLPPSLAVSTKHDADARTREAARSERRMPRGSTRHHRAAQPRAARVGQLLPHGNAATKFMLLDDYVVKRLRSLRVKRKGRHLRPGEAKAWRRPYFQALGLHSLAGTVQYPEAA
jgi:hypothetical protein